MPLSAIQKKVFRLLREHRNPDSHVAGASALHAGQDSPRYSEDEFVRTNRYRPEDFAPLQLAHPVFLPELKQAFLRAVSNAEELINRLPQVEVGCLYLDGTGRPVTPDPDAPEFPGLVRHYGALRGSWPRIVADQDAT